MHVEKLPDTESIRRLKGAMSVLEYGAMRLRILGEKTTAKQLDNESIAIRRYLEDQEL